MFWDLATLHHARDVDLDIHRPVREVGYQVREERWMHFTAALGRLLMDTVQ